MRVEKLNNRLYFLIFLLSITGYYAVLILAFNIGLGEATRQLTVPLRLGVVLCLMLSFMINIKKLHSSRPRDIFIIFSVFCIIRLLVDYNQGMERYYIPASNVLLYYVSFAFIPFVVIVSQRITQNQLKVILNALLIGGASFSILTAIFYGSYVGQVGRLTSSTAGEEVINPLALSYTSAMTIGVLAFYMIFHKISLVKKIIFISIIGLSTIPFFLGSSRGAIFALFVPFLINFYYSSGPKKFLRSLIIMVIAIIGLIFLDDYLESGLLDRLIGRSGSFTGETKEARNFTWETSFNQFLDNPILGDSILVDGMSMYPHNIILEVLQSIGLVGFIPFGILLYKGWRICLNIFKYHKKLTWVTIIFVQSFMMGMFSGSIFSTPWFWFGLALLFAVNYNLEKQNKYLI